MIRSVRRAGKAILGASLPRRRLLIHGPRSSWPRMLAGRAFHLALTFDDGPHPEHTPRILDGLGALGLSATFFAVGEHAARHGALTRRIVSEGHDLGNHGHR